MHIAVVIATCDRPELLEGTSLPSVLRQTSAPNIVVVVDDSSDTVTRGLTSSAVWQYRDAFETRGTQLCLLRNSRTAGASGAWNTGILHVMQQQMQPVANLKADKCASTYVAILDDDDCWEPNHLEACLTVVEQTSRSAGAQQSACPMVVSGLIRHTTASQPQPSIPAGAGVKQSLPPAGQLTAEQFYAGNPHIQGSNLFCRLDVLLAVGMFNEWLPSTTDRDLCTRLAQLHVHIAVTGTHTVHHFAPGSLIITTAASTAAGTGTTSSPQPSQCLALPSLPPAGAGNSSSSCIPMPRLSNPSGISKFVGLQRFYHDLWGNFMSSQQLEAARVRSQQLFQIDLHYPGAASPGGPQPPPPPPQQQQQQQQHVHQHNCRLPPGREHEPVSITWASSQGNRPLTSRSRSAPHDQPSGEEITTGHHASPPVLLIGIVSSSGSTVDGLLSDLLQLWQQTQGSGMLGGLEVLLLENGGPLSEGVSVTAAHYQQQGLPVHFISRAQQEQHAAAGLVTTDLASKVGNNASDQDANCCQRLPIGDMRTLLQLHLAAVISDLPQRVKQCAVAWVLDDDKRLLRSPSDPHELDTSFLQHLQQLVTHHTADVVLGCDSGAPPLPPAATVMLGLLDVVANLQALSSNMSTMTAVQLQPAHSSTDAKESGSLSAQPPAEVDMAGVADTFGSGSAALAAAAAFNAAAFAVWPDAYYDLSAVHSSHLCVPLRTEAYYLGSTASSNCSSTQDVRSAAAVAAFSTIAEGLQGLLCGVPFLRHLPAPIAMDLTEASNDSNIGGSSSSRAVWEAEPSIHRGGSTFILNHKALTIPQHAFSARRSDMLWCLAAQCQGMKVVKCTQLAVLHERRARHEQHDDQATSNFTNSDSSNSAAPACQADAQAEGRTMFDGTIDDIQGHSLYRAVQAGLEAAGAAAAHLHGKLLGCDSSDVLQALQSEQVLPLLREFRLNRATAFASAFRRTQGLITILQQLLSSNANHWWCREPRVGLKLSGMRHQLGRLQHLYTTEALGHIWSKLVADDEEQQRQDLSRIGKVLAQLTAQQSLTQEAIAAVAADVMHSRQAYAQQLIARVLSPIPSQARATVSLMHKSSGASHTMSAEAVVSGEQGDVKDAADVVQLDFLGVGLEGLVFSHVQQLIKLCFWAKALQRCPAQLEMLAQLQENNVHQHPSSTVQLLATDQSPLTRAAVLPTFAVQRVQHWGPQWLLFYGPHQSGAVMSELVLNDAHLALHHGYMCSGAQLLSLARRSLAAPLISCNVHPKNIILLPVHSKGGAQSASTVTAQYINTSIGSHGGTATAAETFGAESASATDGQLLLLDLGCDWVPAAPSVIISMLARLYLSWRWWRRQDLPQLLSHATQLLTAELEGFEPDKRNNSEATNRSRSVTSSSRSMSSSHHDPTTAAANLEVFLSHVRHWLHTRCTLHTTGTADMHGSSSSGSSRSSGTAAANIDVLWLTEDLPELAGFGRFAAAALGCYDDAKQMLDDMLVDRTVELLRDLPAEGNNASVLDYGCGPKAKLLHQLEVHHASASGVPQQVQLIGADPCYGGGDDGGASSSRGSMYTHLGVESALKATADCHWAARGAGGLVPSGYDVVICSLVLCTIADRQECLTVLDDLAMAVKPGSGRLLLAVCNPYFTLHGSTVFQHRHTSPGQQYHDVFCWIKNLQQTGTGKMICRRDVHRPVNAVLHDLARRGLALDWLHETPSVDLNRPDEFNSDFLVLSLVQTGASCCIAKAPAGDNPGIFTTTSSRSKTVEDTSNQQYPCASQPDSTASISGAPAGFVPISCLVKVCGQDHRDVSWLIPDLISKVDQAQYSLAEVVVVVDPHQGPFLRQVSTAPATLPGPEMLSSLLVELNRLKSLGWIDRVVVAEPSGSQAVQIWLSQLRDMTVTDHHQTLDSVCQDINQRWFGIEGCKETHTAAGVATTPTLQGLEACHHDIVLQLDVDIMFVGRPFEQLSEARQMISNCSPAGAVGCSFAAQHSRTLEQLAAILHSDPKAVSISLPSLPAAEATGADPPGTDSCRHNRTCGDAAKNPVMYPGLTLTHVNPRTGKPWRTEVRGCMLHRSRLLSILPLPRAAGSDTTESLTNSPPSWYRALDAAVAASAGSMRCYRAHFISRVVGNSQLGHLAPTNNTQSKQTTGCLNSSSLSFLHPPNQPIKESSWSYSLVRSALQAGCWPQDQAGQIDVISHEPSGNPEVYSSAVATMPTTGGADFGPAKLATFSDPCCSLKFMSGLAALWALPRRNEALVVVVCGRNVAPGRFQRCLESLMAQTWQGWGMILVDDCSTDSTCVAYQGALLQYAIPSGLAGRVTHLAWQGSRRGMLFNDVVAIRHVCTNPDTVIVTLDEDDMLLRHDALRLVLDMHKDHDFVTGGHLRTDKPVVGPGHNTGSGCITFAGPQRQRLLRGGGNVWQHLRSFKKRLFDAIPDNRLRMQQQPGPAMGVGHHSAVHKQPATAAGAQQHTLQARTAMSGGPGDVGYYYELANDWAFTVPMAEMAKSPAVLDRAVYLYEPSWPRQDRVLREAIIGTIMSGLPVNSSNELPSRRRVVAVVGDSNLDASTMKAHRVVGDEQAKQLLAEQVGRHLVDAGYRVMTGGLRGVMTAAFKGAKGSLRYKDGDTIAVITGDDPSDANTYADIVLSTGLGHYRNGLIGRSDAVVVIGGGAGSLQEVAVAWSTKRPIVVLQDVSGVGLLLGGCCIDSRGGPNRLPVMVAADAARAVDLITTALLQPDASWYSSH